MDDAGEPRLGRRTVRMLLVAALVVVGIAGLVVGVYDARFRAISLRARTDARSAHLVAQRLADGVDPASVVQAWRAQASGTELLLLDQHANVSHRAGGEVALGAPLAGELADASGDDSAQVTIALDKARDVRGVWTREGWDAVFVAVPRAEGAGWVVTATPLREVRTVVLPMVAPAIMLLAGLLAAVIAFGRASRRARSATDLVGAFRSARVAERHRMRRVTRSLPALLFERVTFPEGRGAFTWVSPNSAEFLELDATDLVVDPNLLLSLVHPDDRCGLRESMRAAEQAPHDFRWEGRMVLPSGKARWFRSTARRVEVNDTGTRWCGFIVDITDQRMLEAALKQRGRLATIGQLAAGVAHEINNPLSYVIGNTRVVLEAAQRGEAALPADLVEALEDAAEGGERVARIVQDLRTLARGGDLGEEPGPVDLEQILRTAARQVEIDLKFRARLGWDVPADLPLVHGHDDRLVQVVHNLLKNACLAIPMGDPAGNEVRISAVADGDRVRVRIEDSGPGVPARLRDRIFDPFFTTRDGTAGGHQGQGLGLAVSLSIVDRLGGTLSLTEAPSLGGACFEVTLQVADAAGAGPSDPVPTLSPQGVLRLLVVDDEDAVLRSLTRQLRPHHVAAVPSAADALALIDDDADFDGVVCDVMMPGMSGVELYEQMVREHPALARRFVFLTGGTVSDDIRGWLDRSRVPLVEKPAQPERVLDAIARLQAASEPSATPPVSLTVGRA